MAKNNSETATLRKSNMPRAEKVRDAKAVPGACIKAAKQQAGDSWANYTDNELARKGR
jgi:hypothetical protein